MLTSVLPYVEGSDTDRKLRRLAFANKIRVIPKYSSDGRGYDASVYMDYSPKDGFALYMMERILNSSDNVVSYSVFDEKGERITYFEKSSYPKRS